MKEMYILSLVPAFIYVFIKSKKSLHMLQQNFYNENNRYLKWISRNLFKVFLEIDMAFVVFVSFMFLTFNVSMLLYIIFYSLCIFLYVKRVSKEQVKKPLVITARIRRLYTTLFILFIMMQIPVILNFDQTRLPYYYMSLGIIIYINFIMIYIVNVINKPVEKFVFLKYRRQATKKMKNMNNIPVVGITGSYGKTSSKNILNDVLSVKYNSFKSPKNYNTTYGIINTINNYLDKFSDIFIAEMGAFRRGDIKELCDLVHPKFGILTKIGTAHLESFGSRENVQKGKFELIESLPSDGTGVLNMDDDLQTSYQLKNDCKIIWIAIENEEADIRALNIKLSNHGTTFDVKVKGEKEMLHLETKLLGRANVYNILGSLAIAKELGLTNEQITIGVRKVSVIEHRLELKKYKHVTLIDDAYNSNPVGAEMALEVLSMMPGKKMIVTPGMIELADAQYELNLNFGKQIAKVCDEVILVGETQTKPIYDGLLTQKFQKQKVHVINDVMEAFEIIEKFKTSETFVLIENDLPDLFNEKE